MNRLLSASLIVGSFLISPATAFAHPFLGALPYAKADTSAARSKEDCMKIERGRNHKRPPKLIGFPKHEHYYVPGRTGDKCVTVFHDLRRGISSYNNEKGEFIEVPTRQIQKRLFP